MIDKDSSRSLRRPNSMDVARANYLNGQHRPPGFIAFIIPTPERSRAARAYARTRGHELGPWMEHASGYKPTMQSYYATALCIRCGTHFHLFAGGYDGWAAHSECNDKNAAYARGLVPGPQPDAHWSTGHRISLTEGMGIDDKHMALEAAS